MRCFTLGVGTAALLACGTAAHAQGQPATVPIEFIELLWMSPFGGRPQPAVGRLPERLAADLRPLTDARIVGSMMSARFSVLPGQAAEARERVLARLLEAGWSRQPVREEPEGGFELAEGRRNTQVSLCSADGHSLQLNTSTYHADSAAISLLLSSGRYGADCGAADSTDTRPYGEAPVPALRAPAGSQHLEGGTGGSIREAYVSARLRTELSPGALLAHYGPQMIAQGWRPESQSSGDDVAIHVFRMTDANGVAWQSVLYVTLLPSGQRDLYLRMTRNR